MENTTVLPEVDTNYVANLSLEDHERLLAQVQLEITETYSSVIAIIAILSIIGIIGNVFTAIFYGFYQRKSSSVALITYLAAADVIVCVLISLLIMEMTLNVNYPYRALCKIAHFSGHSAVSTSVLILTFIAIDRFRKICRPFDPQTSLVLARRVAIGIVLFALLVSARDFVNFDINEVKLSAKNGRNVSLVGMMCSNTDDPARKMSVSAFHTIDTVIFTSVFIIMFVTYGQIIYKLCTIEQIDAESSKTRPRFVNNPLHQPSMNPEARTANNDSKDSNESSDNVTGVSKEVQRDDSSQRSVRFSDESQKQERVKPKKSKIKKSERNITKMMLVISCGLIVCFTPYFIIKLGLRSSKTSEYELSVGIQLLLRFPYLNSVINPIVFLIFNPHFRRFIVAMVKATKPPVHGMSDSSAHELNNP